MKIYCFVLVLFAHSENVIISSARYVDLSSKASWSWPDMVGKLSKDEIPVCHTQACYKAALNLWQSVNTSMDPCQDFYTYACGKWMENNPVPITHRHWNKFDMLTDEMDKVILRLIQQPMDDPDIEAVKSAKKIYNACMNEYAIEGHGLEPLVQLLDHMGGWPMAGWNMTAIEWYLLVARSTTLLDVAPLLEVSVSFDKKNTSRRVITVDQPSLTLPRYELTDGISDILNTYKDYVATTADLVANSYGHQLPQAAFKMEADAMVRFETRLAQITKKDEMRRDLQKMYHKVSLSRLQEITNSVPVINRSSTIRWLPFLATLLKGVVPIEDINERTEIVVKDIHFLYHLLMLLDATPARVVVNYIQWRVVKTLSRDLNKAMKDLSFAFEQKTTHVSEDVPRWYECISNAGYLYFAVGYMYVYNHFSHSGKEKASNMVSEIKNIFTKELNEIEWMDATTKAAASEKAAFMKDFMGYPPWYTNHSMLTNYYSGLKVGPNHFENVVNVRKFLVKRSFEKLKRPTDRNEWVFEPAVVNAFYSPELNSIIFPAGILQQPFFSEKQPDSLNYGSIGVIIGHEISHGFDDTGRQGDKLGNVHQWWTKETEQTYMDKSQCFVDQYQQYRVPEIDHLLHKTATVNGVMTLGENIADNGGLRAAYRAFKESQKLRTSDEPRLPGWQHITPDQLFFLGFANVWCESTTARSLLSEVMDDSHSPHRYRVLGTLTNSPEFAAAWHCPSGSPMNPPDKCKLW